MKLDKLILSNYGSGGIAVGFLGTEEEIQRSFYSLINVGCTKSEMLSTGTINYILTTPAKLKRALMAHLVIKRQKKESRGQKAVKPGSFYPLKKQAEDQYNSIKVVSDFVGRDRRQDGLLPHDISSDTDSGFCDPDDEKLQLQMSALGAVGLYGQDLTQPFVSNTVDKH